MPKPGQRGAATPVSGEGYSSHAEITLLAARHDLFAFRLRLPTSAGGLCFRPLRALRPLPGRGLPLRALVLRRARPLCEGRGFFGG